MPSPTGTTPSIGAVIVALGVTQIVGWGTTHYMPAILSNAIAGGLGLSPTTVLGGFSWGLLVAGLSARASGRLMDRHGARRVMTIASLATAVGLFILSLAQGWPALFLGWTLIGLSLRSILYDGAFAALTVLAGDSARRAISLLTLLGGLASTVFWPIGGWLDATLGWRATLQIYALLNLLPCALLHGLFAGGPRPRLAATNTATTSTATTGAAATSPAAPAPPTQQGLGLDAGTARLALRLAVLGFTLHAFVASAMATHLVQLLGSFGLGTAVIVSAASLMGIAQVIARIVEMSLQRRMSAIAAAVPSITLLPTAFIAALALPASATTAAAFVVLYGCSNGLMTVMRGSLPLAVFGGSGYAELLGRIFGPGLVASAAAPILLSALVEATDARMGLGLLALLSTGALAAIGALAMLARRHAPETGPLKR